MIFILILIASIAKAVMDRIKDGIGGSIFFDMPHNKFRSWMDDYTSWQYKWKNGNIKEGERFFGSSTFLVWITDGWHFFQKLFLTAMFLLVILYRPMICGFWDFMIMYFVFTTLFEIWYRLLGRKA